MSIEENVRSVYDRIAAAANSAGRRPEEITLVAATKMNDAERVREAVRAGIKVCGENRVQELTEKDALGAYEGAEKHFIGHLQQNKVNKVVGEVSLIESVDTPELMERISKRAAELGIIQDILIEINIGAEEAKSGISPAQLPAVLEKASALPGIRVRGLMAIPPISTYNGQNRVWFDEMHKLFVDNSAKKYDNVSMDFLSMGMSGDFEDAIACGANMVRVGTSIFGARHYPEVK